MTLIKDENVICPNCHRNNRFTTYKSINPILNPELKDKITNGEIFKFTCEFCQFQDFLDYDLIYHDITNSVIIFYMKDDERIEETIKNFEKIISVNDIENFKDYHHLRAVLHIRHLIEKVHIFDAGLDDRIVEIMKVDMQLDNPGTRGAEWMIFNPASSTTYEILIIKNDKVFGYVDFSQEYYDDLESFYGDGIPDAYVINTIWAYEELLKYYEK